MALTGKLPDKNINGITCAVMLVGYRNIGVFFCCFLLFIWMLGGIFTADEEIHNKRFIFIPNLD